MSTGWFIAHRDLNAEYLFPSVLSVDCPSPRSGRRSRDNRSDIQCPHNYWYWQAAAAVGPSLRHWPRIISF